jgi:hypothetical protein
MIMRTSGYTEQKLATHAGRVLAALDAASVALTIAKTERSGYSEDRKGSNSEETSEHCVDWKG